MTKKECISTGCDNMLREGKNNIYCTECKTFLASKGLTEPDLQTKHAYSIIRLGVYYNEYNKHITQILFEKK